MKTTVTGRFVSEEQAARAVEKLLRVCVPGEHVHAYLLSGRAPLRDMAESHLEAWDAPLDKEEAGTSPAIELDLGPAAADGVRLTAYIASVPDAAVKQEQPAAAPVKGILVAVEAHDQVSQVLAINVLRRHGAQHIQHSAPGQPVAARSNFQPLSLSSLLARADTRRSPVTAPAPGPRKFH